LIAAPFALGYLHANASWGDATKVDVFTGAGILAHTHHGQWRDR
jgi:hypothetical protein